MITHRPHEVNGGDDGSKIYSAAPSAEKLQRVVQGFSAKQYRQPSDDDWSSVNWREKIRLPERHNLSMPPTPKLIIVDTNCYIRLYGSPVRPILGSVFSGYKLVTLTELRLETSLQTDVISRNPWMAAADIQNELTAACLKYREPKTSRINALLKTIRQMGDSILRQYCVDNNIENIRTLSAADTLALAAADELNTCLATDEWPMSMVAQNILEDTLMFTSVGLLHLMESAGGLTKVQRIETVRIWCLTNEYLPRDWKEEYRKLFGEDPPDAQSAKSQSA